MPNSFAPCVPRLLPMLVALVALVAPAASYAQLCYPTKIEIDPQGVVGVSWKLFSDDLSFVVDSGMLTSSATQSFQACTPSTPDCYKLVFSGCGSNPLVLDVLDQDYADGSGTSTSDPEYYVSQTVQCTDTVTFCKIDNCASAAYMDHFTTNSAQSNVCACDEVHYSSKHNLDWPGGTKHPNWSAEGGSVTNEWSIVNNANSIIEDTATVRWGIPGVGSVTYHLHHVSGACSSSKTLPVAIGDCSSSAPIANFSASQTHLCSDSTVDFTDLSTAQVSNCAVSWNWSFPGAIPSSSTEQHPQDIWYPTPGTYTVSLTATNASGFDSEAKTDLISVFAGYANYALSATIGDEDCNNGGTIDLAIAGGNAPYTYAWSSGQQSEDVTALQAGSYTVTVADANGCSITNAYPIQAYAALDLTNIITTAATCLGNPGDATAAPAGGRAPYTYMWDAAASNQTSAQATGLAAGTYQLLVRDSLGCQSTTSVVVPVNNNSMSLATSSTAETCAGSDGSATATPAGAISPYTYLWDAAAGNQTTSTATGLGFGAYVVTVTAAGGCQNTAVVAVSDVCVSGSNDACADATTISCGDALSGSTLSATGDNAGFCTVSNDQPGVWYKLVGSNDRVTLETCGATDFDTRISVYEGSCGTLNCVAGNDDATGCSSFGSSVTFDPVPAQIYYVLVHQAGSIAGDFTLSMACTPRQPNDLCSGALPLPCNGYAVGSTTLSSPVGNSNCGAFNTSYPAVWYAFTGDGSDVLLRLCDSTSYAYQMAVYSGSCGTLSCLGSDWATGNCNLSNGPAEYAITTVSGTEYFVAVGPRSDNDLALGSFTLQLSCTGAASNDNCAAADTISIGDTLLNSTDYAAAQPSNSLPCGSTFYNEQVRWYTFTGDGSVVDITAATADNLALGWNLYAGGCANLACVEAKSGNASSPASARVRTNNGTAYWLAVHQNNISNNTLGFQLSVTSVTAPANDRCFDAAWINCGDTLHYDLSLATAYYQYACCNPSVITGALFPDVWFKFTGTGVPINVVQEYGSTVWCRVYTGSCGALTEVSQYNNAGIGTALGTTYYVRISGDPEDTGAYRLECPAQEPNAFCTTATDLVCGASYAVTGIGGIGGPASPCISIYENSSYWYHVAGNNTVMKIHGELPTEVLQGTCTAAVTCIDNLHTDNLYGTYAFLAEAGKDYYLYYREIGISGHAFTVECAAPYPNPPANDDCQNAINIQCGDSLQGSLVHANSTSGFGGCSYQSAAPVIFYKTTGDGQQYTLKTCGSTIYNTINVFTGSCPGSGSNPVCNSLLNTSTCVEGAEVAWLTQPGQEYIIAIQAFNGNDVGDISISLQCDSATAPSPLVNDECADATPIACGNVYTTSITAATAPGEQQCDNSSTVYRSVWYSYTGSGKLVTLSTCNAADFTPVITVYSGSCGATTCVEEKRDNPNTCSGNGTSMVFLAESGTDYLIRIAAPYSSNQGVFALDVRCAAEPTNINCSMAEPVACGVPVWSSWAGGAPDTLAQCIVTAPTVGAVSGNTMWYQITGTGDLLEVLVDSADYNPSLVILEGSCGNLTCTPVGHTSTTNLSARQFYSQLGVTYYVAVVAAYIGNNEATGFRLVVNCVTADPASACAGASPITCGTTYAFSPQYSDFVSECSDPYSGTGRWFALTGNGTNVHLKSTRLGYSTGGVIAVYVGNCQGLVCYARTNLDPDELTFQAELGQTYYIFASGVQYSDYELAVSCAAPVGNDWCTAATELTCGDLLSGTTNGATRDIVVGTSSGSSNSPVVEYKGVWYTVTGTGEWLFVALCAPIIAQNSLHVNVYTGSCGTLAEHEIEQQPTFLGQHQPSSINCGYKLGAFFYAEPGVEYKIKVATANGKVRDFDIALYCEAPEPNIACTTALPISCGNEYYGNTYAPIDALTPDCPNQPTSGNWYTILGNDEAITLSTCDKATVATNIAVYTGSCGTLVCDTNTTVPGTGCSTNSAELTFFGHTGTQYYVFVSAHLVGGWASKYGEYTLSVDCNCSLAATIAATQASCSGGDASATVSASQGTAPYSYAWSSGTGNQTAATASSLSAGTYQVTVGDAAGCNTIQAAIIDPVTSLMLAYSTTDATCTTGTATATATNGTAPYTYQWGSGAANQTGITATGLVAGTYSVTATDAAGCSIAETVSVSNGGTPVVAASTGMPDCGMANGTVSALISMGATPYTYAWSGTAAVQTTATATGLLAGSYTVTVRDANSCSSTATATLVAVNLPTLATVIAPASCVGADGSIALTVSGSVNPYTYSWDGNAGSQTTATATGLSAGSYYVTVSTSTGCTVVEEVVVPQTTVVATMTTTQQSGFPVNGSAVGNASGGVPPYSYLWSANAGSVTTQGANNLAAGIYTFTVTDAAGCTATVADTVHPNCSTLCLLPTHLMAFNVQDVSAVLKWEPACGATAYQLQYKVAGTSSWTTVWKHTNVGSRTLSGLTPATTYKYRIKTVCNSQGGTSGWSVMQTFTTLAVPCSMPTNLASGPVGGVQAKLTWTPVATAIKYKIRYRVAGATWTTLQKAGALGHHWLTGLAYGTSYEWQIRTLCQYGNVTGTPWSTVQSFTTAPTPKTAHALQYKRPAFDRQVLLIPNPATSQFTIAASGLSGSEAQLQVLDLMGRTVLQATLPLNDGSITHPIAVSTHWGKGLYLVVITDAVGPSVHKLELLQQ